MKMTFRWYGEKDCIPLQYIRQIPNMSGVVTAVYDTPVGEVWEEEKIARLKALCEKEGLAMEVIESVPVHEDIKLGKPSRDRLIANYAQTIRNLGKYGVKCICYNFIVFKEKLCAVRLNALPVRVIPGFSGRNAVVHVTPPNRPKIRRPRG